MFLKQERPKKKDFVIQNLVVKEKYLVEILMAIPMVKGVCFWSTTVFT